VSRPPVVALLSALPDEVLTQIHYGVRHPLGTFNTKFGKVVSELSICIGQVNSFGGKAGKLNRII
jgi:hypothetical protein